jgi:O-antigen/teichoic acid export membrane protein
VYAVTALVPNLVNLGLPNSMMRFLSAEKNKSVIKKSFYSMMLLVFVSTMITSLIFLVFSSQISNAIFDGNMQIMYIVIIISFLASINLMLLTYFRTFQRMKSYCVFFVLQTYIGVGVSIILTLMKNPIEVVVLGLLTGYLFVFIGMSFVIIRELGITTKLKNLKEELKFALPTVPNNISSWVVDSSDKFVIGIYLSSTAVGCYSPGYALGSIIAMFLSPFSTLLPAVLPEYYEKGDNEKVTSFLNYSLKYYLLITIPAVAGISLLSKPLLYILTTDIIANQGYIITPLVAISAICMGFASIISNILFLEKKTFILSRIWILAAALNLIFNIITVPYLGIFGAGFVTLCCYFIMAIAIIWHCNKYSVIPFDYKSLLKIVVSTAIMGLFIKIYNPMGIFEIVFVIIISVAIYFVALFLIKGIDKKEIDLIKGLIH